MFHCGLMLLASKVDILKMTWLKLIDMHRFGASRGLWIGQAIASVVLLHLNVQQNCLSISFSRRWTEMQQDDNQIHKLYTFTGIRGTFLLATGWPLQCYWSYVQYVLPFWSELQCTGMVPSCVGGGKYMTSEQCSRCYLRSCYGTHSYFWPGNYCFQYGLNGYGFSDLKTNRRLNIASAFGFKSLISYHSIFSSLRPVNGMLRNLSQCSY